MGPDGAEMGQDAEKRPSLAMRLRRYGNCTVVRTPRGTPRWAKTFSDRARIAPRAARVPLQIRPKSAPRCPFWLRPGRQDFQRFSIPFWIDFCSIFPPNLAPQIRTGPKAPWRVRLRVLTLSFLQVFLQVLLTFVPFRGAAVRRKNRRAPLPDAPGKLQERLFFGCMFFSFFGTTFGIDFTPLEGPCGPCRRQLDPPKSLKNRCQDACHLGLHL